MKQLELLAKNKTVQVSAVVIIIFFVVVKPVLNLFKTERKTDVLKNIQIDANKNTISSNEAKELADRREMEMDGVTLIGNGDFWKMINEKIKTVDDAKLVIKAFGVRKGETLIEWLNGEYYMQLSSLGRSILKKFSEL